MKSNNMNKTISAALARPADIGFAEFIQSKLDEMGITKNYLCRAIKIDNKSLTRILTGEAQKVDVVTILKLGDFMQVGYGEFIERYIAELQTRIKIDRFTGGTIESALFETMPLFNQYNPESDNPSEKVRNVRITITDYEPYEAGLMLLILKDLWTGDLAVGGEKGVGRGTFKGFRAEIEWNGKNVTIDKNLSVTPPESKPELENFVKELADYGI